MNDYCFSVIVEKNQDGYFASCNELQGCYAQGETQEEVILHIKNAIQLHIEDRTKSGEKIPQMKTVNPILPNLWKN